MTVKDFILETTIPPKLDIPFDEVDYKQFEHKAEVTPEIQAAVNTLIARSSIPVDDNPRRRAFFTHLVVLNYRKNARLSTPPLVTKKPIDLRRLYIAVRRRGGFKQVGFWNLLIVCNSKFRFLKTRVGRYCAPKPIRRSNNHIKQPPLFECITKPIC
jgi:hypothetical protein